MKLRFCRVCGKKGIKFASDGCRYCGSDYISDIAWKIKKKEGLTKGRVLKNNTFKESFKNKSKRVGINTLSTILGVIGWPLIIFLICFIWAVILVFFW